MTPQERQILEEAEQQAFETARAYNESRTRGIQPEPTVEETETTLEGQLFGFDFGVEQGARVLPGASIPVTEATCPTTESITGTFIGIVPCFEITGDFNGAYVLTETFTGSGIWEGAGGDYDPGTGTIHTVITIQCNDGGFSLDYRDEFGTAIFLSGVIGPPPPSGLTAPNVLTCDDGIAHEGTGTIT